MNKLKQLKETISNNPYNKTLFKNISGAFIIKGAGLVVSLFTMPAFISYFGNQAVLGVWFTVLSVITWILNFDLGIGNGLRNHLAVSIAKNDNKKSKELISSAYIIFGIIVVFLMIIGYFTSSFINWNRVFNITEELVSLSVLTAVVRYIFIGIALQLFFNAVTSILYALQKSAINNLIALIISISQLVFVLAAPSGTPQDNLVLLSKAYIFLTCIPYLAITIVVFSTFLKTAKPNFHYFKWAAVKEIMTIGSLFFVCQILYMIIVSSNEIFITSYTAPQNTVDYNIYNKLFMLTGTIVMLALTPVWSMVTKSIAEKQYVWLNNLFKKSLKISMISILLNVSLVFVLQIVVNLWLGDSAIKISYLYAAVFAVWGSLFIYQSILSTFVCGTGRMKLQAVSYGVGVAFKIIFLMICFRFTDSWIIVILSNIIIILPYCIIQHKSLNHYFRQLKESTSGI